MSLHRVLVGVHSTDADAARSERALRELAMRAEMVQRQGLHLTLGPFE